MTNEQIDFTNNIFQKVNSLVYKEEFSSANAYLNLIIDNYPDAAATAYHYKGYIYFEKYNDIPNALKNYTKAIEFRPNYCEVYISRAVLYRYDLAFDSALKDISMALSLQPDNKTALFNKAVILLSLGDYLEGWKLFEHRLSLYPKLTPSEITGTRWCGTGDVTNKTLLIYTEQGLGDSVQFLRYIPIITTLFDKVMVYLPALLNPIFQQAGQVQVLNKIPENLHFDYFCSLLSLPYLLKDTIQAIPNTLPYIHPHTQYLSKWQELVGVKQRKRIGISWHGSQKHWNDKNRSAPLTEMLPLLTLDADIYPLNKEICEEDHIFLYNFKNIHDYSLQLNSLEDTVALMCQLDYIVTVDTLIAHLAGTFNLNTLILLPYVADFRWLQDRSDSPWYPNARLFRQIKRNDWNDPIQEVVNLITSPKEKQTA